MIRLVVTDLDGTIVGKDELLPPEFVAAVKEWEQSGIGYTFATGRVSAQVQEYVKALNLKLPYITANGGMIVREDTILSHTTIPLSFLREIFHLADEMGMSLLYSVDGEEISYRETEYIRTQQDIFGRYRSPQMPSEDAWKSLELDKLVVMARLRDGSLNAIEELCKRLPEQYYYKRYANKAIDILPANASKEKAVAALARMLDIPLDEVLAAGDDLNDIEMLREVGIGVAVGNALDCVKAAADYVSEKQRHLGVMEAVDQFCMKVESGAANK